MPNHQTKKKTGQFHMHGKAARFRVGDKVKVRFGAGLSTAKIVEDRGPIGVNGRRLVRVQLANSDADPESTFEVPEEEVTPA